MANKRSDEISDLPPFSDSEIEIDDISWKPSEKLIKIKEQTAKRIATCLVFGFILLLSFPFMYLFSVVIITDANQIILESTVTQVIDLVTTVSAVLGGIVGAVVTYYFTVVSKKEN